MSSQPEEKENADHRSARQTLFMDVIKSSSSSKGSPRTTNDSGPTMTKAVEFKAAVIGGCLLSINAGCINAITVMETGYTSSHLTGATTNAAITLVQFNDFRHLVKNLGIIFFFTLGGTVTGLLGGHFDEFKLGHTYGRIFFCCFGVLVLALIAEATFPNSFSFLFLCAMACGMQNAMTTKFSGNMIRTSHVSGAFTDIGLTIGRLLRGRKELRWKLGLLCPMALSFFGGSMLGGGLYPVFGRKSLLINIILFGLTSVAYILYFSKAFNVSYYNAIVGESEFTVMGDDQAAASMDVFDFNELRNYSKMSSSVRLRAAPSNIPVIL